MFGYFKTNRGLRAQVEALKTQISALGVRLDKNNATISGLRELLANERRAHDETTRKATASISMLRAKLAATMGDTLGDTYAGQPNTAAQPAAARTNRVTKVIKMPSRYVKPDDPIINHGTSSPDLGDMMTGGLMRRSIDSETAPANHAAPPVISGGGGNFGGGGASSSWGDSSSSSPGSSDSSSSSDSGSSSSSD